MDQVLIDDLNMCRVEGNIVYLPEELLTNYAAVRKALLNAGSTYKKNTFVFSSDAQPFVDRLTSGKSVNIKKEFQFFPTPEEVGQRMINMINFESVSSVLEPSAGQGALVDLLPKLGKRTPYTIECIELMPENVAVLEKKGYSVLCDNFLEVEFHKEFDLIIANPPFTKNQDIKHIMKMYELLSDKGQLVTLCGKHFTFADDKASKDFRDFLEDNNGKVEEIEAGAFKSSGTSVETIIVKIVKSVETEVKPIKPEKPSSADTFGTVELSKLIDSKDNPRGVRNAQAFEDLVSSIKEKGILTSLILRRVGKKFHILAGSRRYHAAKLLKLEKVPATIKDVSDEEAYEIMLIENLQRENVHPMDEAKGFLNLLGYLKPDQKDAYAIVATKTGKTEKYVLRNVKLNSLIEKAKKHFYNGVITVEHALLICRLTDKDQEKILSEKIRTYPKTHAEPVISWKGWIESSTTRLLKNACFKPDDADLHPDAGPCTICPKNTQANALMFDDMNSGAICTDRECFAAKGRKHVSAERKKLKDAETDFLEGGITPYYSNDLEVRIQGTDYPVKKKSECKKPLLVLLRTHNTAYQSSAKSRAGQTVYIENPRKPIKKGEKKAELAKPKKDTSMSYEERQSKERKVKTKRHYIEARMIVKAIQNIERKALDIECKSFVQDLFDDLSSKHVAILGYALKTKPFEKMKSPEEAISWIQKLSEEEGNAVEKDIVDLVTKDFDPIRLYTMLNGLSRFLEYWENRQDDFRNKLLDLGKVDEKKMTKSLQKEATAYLKETEKESKSSK